DEVPPLRDLLQGNDERRGIAGRAGGWCGRDQVAVGVGDRDDREPRLDRLAVGQRDLGRRRVEHLVAERIRTEEDGVRPRGAGEREGSRGDRDERKPPHASSRLPPMRATSPMTTPTTPSTTAIQVMVDVPPPPSDDLAWTTGAGVSESAGPDQSTT